jgi:predicted DNA-binding transcriptional regulator AlpA
MYKSDHGPTRPTTQGVTTPVALFAFNADPLMTAREAADYRRQGLSTFWRQVKLGQVPKPIYITPRSPRWRLSDLCPQRPAVTPNN